MRSRSGTARFSLYPFFSALLLAPAHFAALAASPQSDAAGLSVAEVRKALTDEQVQIAAHPHDPANYVSRAYTLTDAGMGEPAWESAREATLAAPQSSFAYSAQGWVLRHNALGVEFGRGFDYEGSIASYRKAIELAPDDLEVRQSFADSLEYNKDGIRYAPDAHLPEAIRALRYIKSRQREVAPAVKNNLLMDLFYSGQYEEVAREMAGPATPVRDGVALAAIAAGTSSANAIAMAGAWSGDSQRRSAALNFAAEGLWNTRQYGKAADLLAAGMQEGQESSATLGKIQLFRTLKAFQPELPASDPRSPVEKLIAAAMGGTLTEAIATQIVSQHAFADETERQTFLSKIRESSGQIQALSVKTGLPFPVMRDLVLGSIKLLLEPSDKPGFRIVMQSMAQLAGSTGAHFFVVNENGVFKIAAGGSDFVAVGNQALSLAAQGREAEARSLLDWQRDHVEKGGGDDPLGGVLFARFWTSGQSGSSDAIQTAVSALLVGKAFAHEQMPRLVALKEHATATQRRADLELLLASLAVQASDNAAAKQFTRALLQRFPDSPTAINLAGQADILLHDWSGWDAMLDSRLAKHPNDRNLLQQKAQAAEFEGDYLYAQKILRVLLDGGQATAADYNHYAWLGLFTSIDAQAQEAAEQANLMGRGTSFAELHTLACIYAAQGKTVEARQLLLQAMSSANLSGPNGAVWFGLIYEQYGVIPAAIAAYKRVEKPEGPGNPIDSWHLAQLHLKQLQAQ